MTAPNPPMVATTLRIDNAIHGRSEGFPATYCGIDVTDTAEAWDDTMTDTYVCPVCKQADLDAATTLCEQWLREQPDLRAIAGPCGHLLMIGNKDQQPPLAFFLAMCPVGHRIVTPTVDQLVGFAVHERLCDLCTPTRTGSPTT